MNYMNNWRQPIELAAGATSCALEIPDGQYRLTLADSAGAATRWEIVDATVSDGMADLTRGVEGTEVQEWPAGSVIYCSITAQQLNSVFQQLADLEQRVAALESGPPLRMRLWITSGVPSSSDRWLYRVTAKAGDDEVAVFTAQELADLNGYYYNATHYSGAAAAELPRTIPGDYIIDLGVSASSDWTHLVLEWGGQLINDTEGYVMILAEDLELGIYPWSGRSSSETYADRFVDTVYFD